MEKKILKMYEIEYGNEEYPYNVKIYNYLKGNLHYTGVGKFCKSLEDVYKYVESEGFGKPRALFKKNGYILENGTIL
ncbi:hypothetical protein KB151_003897 [[Clostridium] innocuum]|nr:hypothetical protein [[Clostridium] innocuum]